jgi:hypothetical protein
MSPLHQTGVAGFFVGAARQARAAPFAGVAWRPSEQVRCGNCKSPHVNGGVPLAPEASRQNRTHRHRNRLRAVSTTEEIVMNYYPPPWVMNPHTGVVYGFDDAGIPFTICTMPPQIDRSGKLSWDRRQIECGRMIQAAPLIKSAVSEAKKAAKSESGAVTIPAHLWTEIVKLAG